MHFFSWLQAEDLLDDILSFEAGSLGDGLKDGQAGSLTNIPDLQIKPEPLLLTEAEIHALAKDRQKKDNHNMSKSITYHSFWFTFENVLLFFRNIKISFIISKKCNAYYYFNVQFTLEKIGRTHGHWGMCNNIFILL